MWKEVKTSSLCSLKWEEWDRYRETKESDEVVMTILLFSLLTTSSTISTSSVADIRLHYINSRENCAWEITDWWRGEQFSKRKNIYFWLPSNMISLFNLLVIIIMVKLRRKMGKVNVNENWYFFEKYLFGKSFFPPAIVSPTQLLHINKSIYNTLPTLRVLSREQPI